MMMDEDTLKYNSQCPKLIQVLAMLTMLSKHSSSLMTSLRYFHEILSGLGEYELLHLLIAIVNSFLERKFHDEYCLNRSSSNKTCSLVNFELN